MTLQNLKKDLREAANPAKAKILKRFFKTGLGEYGERDIFFGVMVPETRNIAKKYLSLALRDIEILLKSRIHEERLIALLLLHEKFKKAPQKEKEEFVQFYLSNTVYVNNWDLVDLSAHQILGEYLLENPKKKDIIRKNQKTPLFNAEMNGGFS